MQKVQINNNNGVEMGTELFNTKVENLIAFSW